MTAFGRNVELTIDDKVIKYPDLEMSFEVNFDTKSDGNVGNIKVYNLSKETIRLIKKNAVLSLKAGYKDDIDYIFIGVVASATTKWKNPDKETEIIIGDHTDAWLNTTINQTWRKGIQASKVIKDVVAVLPLEIGKIEIPEDKSYPKAKTFSCTCKKALEELAADLSLKLHVNKGKIYLRSEDKGTEQIVILNKDTGLIGSPQEISTTDAKKDKYKIQSLLNYRIESDLVLKVESNTINGYYRVEQGKHFLSGDDFLTEIEVSKYEE
jgi:hypothetical protein